MKKNTLLLLLLCLTAALLCACASENGAGEPETGAVPEAAPVSDLLRISEVMSVNKACLAEPGGSFPDWVELQNRGGETVSTEGFLLESGDEVWPLPVQSLEPGEFLLLSVKLASEGGELRLLSASGEELDRLELPELEEDQSWQLLADGDYAVCDWPSPGYENTEEGYILAQENIRPMSDDLSIGEVMVYNDRYLPVGGAYYDWVELINPTNRELELSEYCLSDKGKQRSLYRLPEQTLAPGECAVILCDADMAVGAPFGLSAQRETLYLSHADGTLCDYVSLHDIPYGCSFGRRAGESGFFFFNKPSPGQPNEGGARLLAQMPELDGEDGVFENVDGVTVTLNGQGDIRYTLDGSEPSGASELYTGPFELKETAVLRAVCYMPNRLRSPILTKSFLINEGHTLPVVSLACDPNAMFGEEGIYTIPWLDDEIPASVELFEPGGGGFAIDCGVKIHGATSRMIQQKKSLKLCFRPRYEGQLHYDLFDNGVLDFASVLLRADQESDTSTYMHDNIIHQLAVENFPALPAQDGRYAILYINGAYWGIYSIREAHSETHYANHYGYDVNSVSHWKEKWPYGSQAEQTYYDAVNRNLRIQENYDRVAEHLNIDSLIAWTILELYSGNVDYNSPNMRFYWSEEDQRLSYALVDLDLGMFNNGGFEDIFGFKYHYNYLVGRLLQNPGFRAEFLRQCGEALRGPLSDEAVLAIIDEREAELRPEIDRDMQRWGDTPVNWRYLVEQTRVFVRHYGGRAQEMRDWLRVMLRMSGEEYETYFG